MAQFIRNSSATFFVVPQVNRQIAAEGFKLSSKKLFYKQPVDKSFSGLAKSLTKNFGWSNPSATISIIGLKFVFLVKFGFFTLKNSKMKLTSFSLTSHLSFVGFRKYHIILFLIY